MKEKKIYAVKNCEVCGTEYNVYYKSRIDTSRYCSRTCMGNGRKGIKKPHSEEWERNRLAAVREYAKTATYRSGYKRPREHVVGMIKGHEKFRQDNPDKHKSIAIKNLSRSKTLNLSNENSPNWKGGITKEYVKWRNKHRDQFSAHRDMVLQRDGFICKNCGSSDNLQVHHILSVAECKSAAFLPMNGVTLCKKCHHETDNYGAKNIGAGEGIGNRICIGMTIPHKFHEYPTAGNYQWTPDGILIIFISELGNELYEKLVFFHEFIEATMCKERGIDERVITEFDIMFEEEREKGLHGDFDEPGDDPRAPYLEQHKAATKAERILCAALGINWKEYEEKINAL